MKTRNYQNGVGLIEVLVAMLILAIGVLGFIALQYRAVEATHESTYRVQAINLARDMAERMRVNRGAVSDYQTKLKKPVADQIVVSKNCSEEDCTAEELASYDVTEVAQKAHATGMTMTNITCRGNETGDKRSCIYVAWGDTSATNGTGEGDCTNGSAYNPISTCLIMEVY